MACKATLKAKSIIEDFEKEKETLNEAKDAVAEGKIEATEYTEKDYKRDLTIIYRFILKMFLRLSAEVFFYYNFFIYKEELL